jgi:hypothetical protein
MNVVYPTVMAFFVIGYLVSIINFTDYLRHTHYRTWVDLGEPEVAKVRTGSIQDSAQQLQAFLATWQFIFSNAHATMKDSRLSTLVLPLRILIAGCLLLFLGVFLLPR